MTTKNLQSAAFGALAFLAALAAYLVLGKGLWGSLLWGATATLTAICGSVVIVGLFVGFGIVEIESE